MADELSRTVRSRVPKTSDIEIHLSTVETPESGLFLEIREYVLSLDQYGRGITFPVELAGPLLEPYLALSETS